MLDRGPRVATAEADPSAPTENTLEPPVPDDSEEDSLFASHPDLVDPQWQRIADRATRQAALARPRTTRAITRTRKPAWYTGRRPLGAAVAVLVFAIVGSGYLGLHDRVPSAQNASSVTETGATATDQRPEPINLSHPFATTPAAGWADGIAGIRLPVATPVGTHSAQDVTGAYATATQALVAAHLDPKMLVAHDPTAYLALLAPDARAQDQSTVVSALAPGRSREVTLLTTGFPLLSVPVKVNGSMSISTDADDNLVVHTNYVFAYPFKPLNMDTVTDAWQIIAVQHFAADYTVIGNTRKFRSSSQGLWLTHVQSYDYSMSCAQSDKGFLAPAFSDPSGAGGTRANPDTLYDPNHSLDIPDGCGPS